MSLLKLTWFDKPNQLQKKRERLSPFRESQEENLEEISGKNLSYPITKEKSKQLIIAEVYLENKIGILYLESKIGKQKYI